MNTLKDYISEYLNYCEYRKQLNFKTIKAYKIDLNQYNSFWQHIKAPLKRTFLPVGIFLSIKESRNCLISPSVL